MEHLPSKKRKFAECTDSELIDILQELNSVDKKDNQKWSLFFEKKKELEDKDTNLQRFQNYCGYWKLILKNEFDKETLNELVNDKDFFETRTWGRISKEKIKLFIQHRAPFDNEYLNLLQKKKECEKKVLPWFLAPDSDEEEKKEMEKERYLYKIALMKGEVSIPEDDQKDSNIEELWYGNKRKTPLKPWEVYGRSSDCGPTTEYNEYMGKKKYNPPEIREKRKIVFNPVEQFEKDHPHFKEHCNFLFQWHFEHRIPGFAFENLPLCFCGVSSMMVSQVGKVALPDNQKTYLPSFSYFEKFDADVVKKKNFSFKAFTPMIPAYFVCANRNPNDAFLKEKKLEVLHLINGVWQNKNPIFEVSKQQQSIFELSTFRVQENYHKYGKAKMFRSILTVLEDFVKQCASQFLISDDRKARKRKIEDCFWWFQDPELFATFLFGLDYNLDAVSSLQKSEFYPWFLLDFGKNPLHAINLIRYDLKNYLKKNNCQIPKCDKKFWNLE